MWPSGVGGIAKGQAVTYTLSDGKKIQKVTEVVFSPHSGPMTTSVGIPRTVVVIGATVTL